MAVKKGEGRSEVVYSRVTIPRWGESITGWLTRPQHRPAPGLVIAPYAWGVTGFMEMLCHQLSRSGYSCLAVEPYSRGGKPKRSSTVEQARATFAGLNRRALVLDLMAGLEFLRKSDDAAPDRVGVMGIGDGGPAALELAGDRQLGLRSLVMVYGALPQGEGELPPIGLPVLGLYGGKDDVVPADAARAFAGLVAKAGGKPELYVYPDAQHNFLDDEREEYDPGSSDDAFAKLLAFLEKTLR